MVGHTTTLCSMTSDLALAQQGEWGAQRAERGGHGAALHRLRARRAWPGQAAGAGLGHWVQSGRSASSMARYHCRSCRWSPHSPGPADGAACHPPRSGNRHGVRSRVSTTQRAPSASHSASNGQRGGVRLGIKTVVDIHCRTGNRVRGPYAAVVGPQHPRAGRGYGCSEVFPDETTGVAKGRALLERRILAGKRELGVAGVRRGERAARPRARPRVVPGAAQDRGARRVVGVVIAERVPVAASSSRYLTR